MHEEPMTRAHVRSSLPSRASAGDQHTHPGGGAMRKFSVRPTLTLKGRKFKGLRGWSGKPLHPPLTDFPITAYVLGAVFDVVSVIGGTDHEWAHDFWRAGTFSFVAGGSVSVFAA